ncbi:MAG: carboxypeptidase-like regulatory domain-containing protein [Paludibacteraceae bacterium]|nr:carboxypeptidase-like regulatory domain-containing protein [Paludibacteraceae bacterium]
MKIQLHGIVQYMLLLFFTCFFTPLTAQETIVVGQVVDAQTGEGVMNANIYFAHSQIGVASNSEGYFLLRTSEQHPKQLLVSAIGYKKKKFVVTPGQSVGVQVSLEPDNALLPEIIAIPGANPAWELLENARLKANANNFRLHKDVTVRMDEHNALSVSQLSSRSLSRGLWKALNSGVILSADSSYFIPLYLSQKSVTIKGREQEETLINAEGFLSSEQMEALLTPMQDIPDFYQNSVTLFGKNFISPLSSNGKRFYHYFLIDSTSTAAGKSYLIRFRPKTNGILAFEGSLSLDSARCALESIDVHIPSVTNVNYVREYALNQLFDTRSNVPLLLKSTQRALLDYAIVLDTTSRQFPSLLIEKTLSLQNDSLTHSSYPLAHSNDLQLHELKIRSALDSLHNTPLFRLAKWVAEPFLTNYLNLYYIDMGRLSDIIRINPVEKVALGIPFRTSERLCRHATIGGYGIYGFRDKTWKWGAYIQAKLPTKQLHTLRIGLQDDYVRSEMNNFDLFKRDNASAAGYQNILTLISPPANSNLKPFNFERKREISVLFRNEWHDDFESKIAYFAGKRHYGDPTLGYSNTPFFTYHTLLLTGRLSFHERTHDIYFQRLYIRNHLPIISVGLEGGFYKTTHLYTPYGKAHLAVKQKLNLGIAGHLDYMVDGGLVMGNVPYPLLEIMHGNQTWSLDEYKFSLMGYGEFAADRYITLHAKWNAGGLLFNLIPWVNRLNLREMFSLKMAYGALSPRHADVLPLPNGMHAPHTPYIEVGTGIGNILRVLNVESVWRLTHRKHTHMPLWGIRFSLALGM